MKQLGRNLLIMLFWFALLIACYALYSRHYHVYTYSRLVIVPTLLFYGFSQRKLSVIYLYFYIGMLIFLISDIMILFGNYDFYYTGLSSITLSYLFIGALFYKCSVRNVHKYLPELSYLLIPIVILSIVFHYYIPTMNDVLEIIQQVTHIVALLLVLYWSVKNRLNKVFQHYFIPSTIIMLVANILFAIDILYFNRQYTFVDSIVVFLHGAYLFMLTKGVKSYKNKS